MKWQNPAGFPEKYPEIKVQMMITNRRVDIINEGFDLALRVRTSLDDDPNLVIRQFEKLNSICLPVRVI